MGEIVAAAITAHQPIIMLPEEVRKEVGNGKDTTLIAGFKEIREALDASGADTLIIFDTHWFTTVEHILAGADHYKGIYTSDELPAIVADHKYDYPGAPELARAIVEASEGTEVRVFNATSANIARQYPTINMVHHLRKDEQILAIGICQTAQQHNFLDFGKVLGEAIRNSDARVALLASGGMSHAFSSMDDAPLQLAYDPALIPPDARAMDEKILKLWAGGDHASVIDLYDEYRKFKPEGFFGHYLMTVGALGGRSCKAPGRMMSEYENSLGTGQVHVWFDLDKAA